MKPRTPSLLLLVFAGAVLGFSQQSTPASPEKAPQQAAKPVQPNAQKSAGDEAAKQAEPSDEKTPAPVPEKDTSVVTADGTAHITRVVPLPPVLSAEARANWSKPGGDKASMDPDVVRRRAATQAWQDGAGKKSMAAYPVTIKESKIGGVPVHIVDPIPSDGAGPVSGPGANSGDPLHYSAIAAPAGDSGKAAGPQSIYSDRVLLCVHGGGFNSDSGSLTESIPIANLTRTRVVSVLYRLSPENKFPAAVDDAVAVYKALLKKYKSKHIAIYGTSAGAILTGEIAVKLKQLKLPEPAALGVFSGFADFSSTGDSAALFTLTGFTGPLSSPKPNPEHKSIDPEYTGDTDARDPVLSPAYADLHGLPPTLFISSSRDFLMSGTTDMERMWLRDGVSSQMVVFDGLPHAFWNDVSLPESREAYATMARFFLAHLER